MKLTSQIKLQLENITKCSLLIDHDCPLGELYDFSHALKSFAIQKMQEQESKKEEDPEVKNE